MFNFTVPTKQDTAIELAAALDLCPDFTVAYDEDEHRFTFEGAAGLYVPYTILAQSTIAGYIGL